METAISEKEIGSGLPDKNRALRLGAVWLWVYAAGIMLESWFVEFSWWMPVKWVLIAAAGGFAFF
ncbi:MAG: hypothetical protein IJT27_02885 [Clostridia bacterium]|nr:hypothetical protein [Clostridia bacterium]